MTSQDSKVTEARRYLVGEVDGSPGWGLGVTRAWGCKHLKSAMQLFERRVEMAESMEVFVWDREARVLIARKNKSTPEQTSEFIKQFMR